MAEIKWMPKYPDFFLDPQPKPEGGAIEGAGVFGYAEEPAQWGAQKPKIKKKIIPKWVYNEDHDHHWKLNEKGEVDIFEFPNHIHHFGPQCIFCKEQFCIDCHLYGPPVCNGMPEEDEINF